jgi:probable HAF family extracellular repeat protein
MDEFTIDHLIRRKQCREDGAARCWAVARKLVLGLALTVASQCALSQAMYSIKPLGYLGGCTSSAPIVSGLNLADQVTGTACNAHGDKHAFLWKNDGNPMVDLGPDEVGSSSNGAGINSSGLVVGTVQDSTGTYGFLSAGSGGPVTKILNRLGGTFVYANALNDSGQVTGCADTPANSDGQETAFLWRGNGSPMLDLNPKNPDEWDQVCGFAINHSGQVTGQAIYSIDGFSSAFLWKNGAPLVNGPDGYPCCINSSGQTAGVFFGAGTVHAFFWNDGGAVTSLGQFAKGGGGSQALALNGAGQTVGWADTRWYGKPHAFVWMNDGTPIRDLGTFGGTASQANDINASGMVTGYAYLAGDSLAHAFLWRNDGTNIVDLNKLIDRTDPLVPFVTLTSGAFITALGDIVADGTDSRTGLQGLYLLQSTGVTTSALTLTPGSLAFGNVPINTSSAAQSVTVTNTSAKAVAITGIALRGTAPKQFAFTDDCGQSLAAHAICTIKVRFKPTTKSAKNAFLDVNGGGGGLRSVGLTGTGA